MAIRREVQCINKSNRTSDHERIRNIGGGGGIVRWKETEDNAIRQILAETHTYWTKGGGRTAEVIVAERLGKKYLKTEKDGVRPDNLLALPECP